MASIAIVGCGSVGGILAKNLSAMGHKVIGVRRKPPQPANGVDYIAADIASLGQLEALPEAVDVVFFMASVDGRGEPAYRAVYETGLGNVLQRYQGKPCFFVSSTRVYGQDAGEWVDENSIAEPNSIAGRIICQAERLVWSAGAGNVVVRFSGIYGPGRGHLLSMARQSTRCQQSPPYYTNRIHQQDCAGVLAFLLAQGLAGRPLADCYLASDDCPARQWDVMSWLAKQMACSLPVVKPMPADAGQNKRCCNRRLKALGYRFEFPDYQMGYRELIRHG